MSSLKKHLLLLFLIANATAEYIALMSVSDILFYAMLGISALVVTTSNGFSSTYRNQCKEIFVLIGIYIIAQMLQMDVYTTPKMLYTLSKVLVLCTMVYCVSENFRYYSKDIIIPLSYVIVALVAIGWVHNRYGSGGEDLGYQVFGFANRNAACTLSSIGYAGFLFMRDKLKKTDYVCIAILLLTVLVGGSRNALAMCVLITMVRFGVSGKMMLLGLLLSIVIIYLLPSLGFELEALNRLEGTLKGTVALDREDQRQAALWMAMQRPWTGWGYNVENIGYAASLTEFGAHNGYYTSLKNLGFPLGSLLIYTVVWGGIKRLKLYFLKDRVLNFHLAVVVAILFGAYQEDYLVGVNQITTNVFFWSFTVLGVWMSRNKVCINR